MKKLILICAIIVFILSVPFIICSEGFLGMLEENAIKSPDSSFSKWSLLQAADIHNTIGRDESALKDYFKYWELYPDDENTGTAVFEYAYCLAKVKRYIDARDAYTYFMDNYPTHPQFSKAQRLKHNIRNKIQ